MKGIEGNLTEDGPCVFLLPGAVKQVVQTRFPHLESRVLFRDFDRSREDLGAALREVRETVCRRSDCGMTISVVAPYFFLRQEGLSSKGEAPTESLDGLRLFANNYTVQGVKIKACKPALNRVYRHLSRQTPARLETCPFLTIHHGIHVVDLSFIPEKCRLDVKRAETILNQCLLEWLITVETADQEAVRSSPY